MLFVNMYVLTKLIFAVIEKLIMSPVMIMRGLLFGTIDAEGWNAFSQNTAAYTISAMSRPGIFLKGREL